MEEAAKSLKSRLSCSNICANVCGFDRDYIWIAGFGDVGAELKINSLMDFSAGPKSIFSSGLDVMSDCHIITLVIP